MDPLEFRLKNLKDARLKAVLEAAAERLGWEKRKSESNRGIGIAGGVSANSQLRLEAHALGNQVGLPVFFPSLALSTDNAAMIAAGGLRQFHHGVSAPLGLNAEASLPL